MKTKPTDSVKNLERITKRGMWWVRLDRAEELITQARAEERERVREMIDRHDPNVKMERETNPAYWGNTLRAELDELIKSDN